MKKEEIESRELQRLIALKSGKIKFEDVTDEDLFQIEDIVLNAYSINGSKTGIDLSIIRLFPNLRSLGISNFDITQQEMDEIALLERLESLEISSCKFNEITFDRLNGRLKHISFCDCEDLPFTYPEVEDVMITGSTLNFGIFDFSKIKNIYIRDSIIKNIHGLEEFENIAKVDLDGCKLYSEEQEEVNDIKVNSKTFYSHQEEKFLVDEELTL